jgi:hypothetical protein
MLCWTPHTVYGSFSNRCPRWSVGGFGRNGIDNIVSDTERMKTISTHVCAKTAFVTLTTDIG